MTISLSDCSPDYQHQVQERRKFWGRVEDLTVASVAIASLLFLYSPQFSTQRKSLSFVSHRQEQQSRRQTDSVVAIAEGWVGKEFNPSESAQCMYWVRAVLNEAGLNPGVTQQPYDGYSTSAGYANSLFGEDIGTLIMDESQLNPGDLVAFANTYGSWEPGTLTHVGIYIGDGEMVDRPTASMPVQRRSISSFDFAVGVRLNGSKEPFIDTPDSSNASLEALARRLEDDYGIPYSFTIAVGNHETGNGSAVIGEDNWFGVKGDGETVTTTEYVDGQQVVIDDGFCSSGCPDSFARTIINILDEQGKTPKGMTPEAIADAVGGIYATDPRWSEKVKEHLQ